MPLPFHHHYYPSTTTATTFRNRIPHPIRRRRQRRRFRRFVLGCLLTAIVGRYAYVMLNWPTVATTSTTTTTTTSTSAHSMILSISRKHASWHPKTRRERFPSAQERVRRYMSIWYQPHDCKLKSWTKISQDVVVVEGVGQQQQQQQVQEYVLEIRNGDKIFRQRMEWNTPLWLTKELIHDCARSRFTAQWYKIGAMVSSILRQLVLLGRTTTVPSSRNYIIPDRESTQTACRLLLLDEDILFQDNDDDEQQQQQQQQHYARTTTVPILAQLVGGKRQHEQDDFLVQTSDGTPVLAQFRHAIVGPLPPVEQDVTTCTIPHLQIKRRHRDDDSAGRYDEQEEAATATATTTAVVVDPPILWNFIDTSIIHKSHRLDTIPWDQKINMAVWRGTLSGTTSRATTTTTMRRRTTTSTNEKKKTKAVVDNNNNNNHTTTTTTTTTANMTNTTTANTTNTTITNLTATTTNSTTTIISRPTTTNRSGSADNSCPPSSSWKCHFVAHHMDSPLMDIGFIIDPNNNNNNNDGFSIIPVDERLVKPRLTLQRRLQYKILMVLDDEDLLWSLFSSSVVIMPQPLTTTTAAAARTSWALEELLEPWVHYVPWKNDTNHTTHDNVQWILEHDDEAQRIAERGTLYVYDLLFHPDAARDDAWIKKEIMKRYTQYWI